jgi:uncharacterized protein (DUF433 family)
MTLPDFLTETEPGEIDLTGHRIGLFTLVREFNQGDCAEMLACRYPSLPLSLVYKVIGFYLENQREIDEYVANYAAALDEQFRNGRHVDLEELRKRLALRENSNVSSTSTR